MDCLVTEKKNYIYTIKINRPEKLNALSPGVLHELEEAANDIENLPDVRVVIITGVGNKAFSAGFDISEIKGSEAYKPGAEIEIINRAFAKLRSCSIPLIAMVNGHAIGAGCDLLLNCDIGIASDNALFGIPAAKLGVIYSAEAIARLVANVGMAVAQEIIYSGKLINASRAYDLGLINKVVKVEELHEATYSLAEEIASNAPLSVKGFKAIFRLIANQAFGLDSDRAEVVRAIIAKVMCSEDAKEGPKAFEEKRKPVWLGY